MARLLFINYLTARCNAISIITESVAKIPSPIVSPIVYSLELASISHCLRIKPAQETEQKANTARKIILNTL